MRRRVSAGYRRAAWEKGRDVDDFYLLPSLLHLKFATWRRKTYFGKVIFTLYLQLLRRHENHTGSGFCSHTRTISKVESHISDRFCALLWSSVTTLVTKFVRGPEPAEAKKYSEVRTGHQALSANHAGTMLDVCERLVPPRAVAVHSK